MAKAANTEIEKRIGQALTQARRAVGLTQAELAQAWDITFQQVQKYEKGLNRLPLSRLIQAMHALDTTPNDLLGIGSGRVLSAEQRSAIAVIELLPDPHTQRLWLELGRLLSGPKGSE